MEFYDYCILADSGFEEISRKAKKLGWDGICVLKGRPLLKRQKDSADMIKGLLIEAGNASDVRKEAKKKRKNYDVIAVRGTKDEINRAAVETPEVDILLPSPGTRIDYVMAKLACKNGVSIGFEFGELLHSAGEQRTRVFRRMLENARLTRKFKAPFVLVSSAVSGWDLRSPSEIMAFGGVLGFGTDESRRALSEGLVERNKKKLSGKWVAKGVEVEGGKMA